MADDLGDDWWDDKPADGEDESRSERQTEQVEKSKGIKHGENIKKQTHTAKEHHTADAQQTQNSEDTTVPKKKKKRRKKKLSQHLAETVAKSANPLDLMTAMLKHYDSSLSPIEKQELQLSESVFLPSNSHCESLSKYLAACIPNWGQVVKQSAPSTKPRSCLLLLVTVSAKRAVDVNREATEFKGKCVSAKLFAKHMKITDQMKLLNKGGAHFAVGTPNRISALIQQDALNAEETQYVILDWNWRDMKLRRMVDVPEIRKDLFELLRKYIVPAARTSGKLKIGLF